MSSGTDYEAELRAASEEVYKHSLELARLKKELEATNARQDTLLHFIGHEVKGFLTKDAGAFAALVEGDYCTLDENAKSFVASALEQTREGVTSVTNILQAANQKKGTVSYAKEPFDFKEVLTEAVEKARQSAERKGLALSLEVDDGHTYTVRGDRGQLLNHVLRNIIDNAVNYTQSGSIVVSLKRADTQLVCSVQDTGVGITPEDKEVLFTEGGHGKDSIKINVHSTGYGLFIARNIVEAHGGTLVGESEGAGKGSTFTLTLPIEE